MLAAGVSLVTRPFGTLSRYTFSHRRRSYCRRNTRTSGCGTRGASAGVPVVFSPDVQLSDFVTDNRFGVSRRRETVNKTYGAEKIGEQLQTMYLAAVDKRSKHKTRTSTS